MNFPARALALTGTPHHRSTILPNSPPESRTRLIRFDPVSVDHANLARLAYLERWAPGTIPCIPPLDLDRSCALARLVRSADVPAQVQEGARAMFRRSVDRLVRSLVWAGAGESRDDFVQEGVIKVFEAIDHYDPNDPAHPENRTEFYKFASRCVRRQLQRYDDNAGSDIRRPVHMREMIRRIYQVEGGLEAQLGRYPTEEEIAEVLGISPEQVRKAKGAERLGGIVQSDQPAGEEGKRTFLGLIADPGPSPEELVLSLRGSEALQRALGFLPWREREILLLRFSLEDEVSLTVDEMGDIFDLSCERIKQLRRRAVETLQRIIPQLEGPRKNRWPSAADRGAVDEIPPFFEQRKMIVKAAAEARSACGRSPSLSEIASCLDGNAGRLWRKIDEDPVLRRRWSRLIARPADLPWPEWVRRAVPIAQAIALDERRPIELWDIARVAGCNVPYLRSVLRKDPSLAAEVRSLVEASQNASWRRRIQSIIKRVRRVPEGCDPLEEVERHVGRETLMSLPINQRDVVCLMAEGLPYQEIADLLNTTYRAVVICASKSGQILGEDLIARLRGEVIIDRSLRIPTLKNGDVIRLRLKGLSFVEIGDKLGVRQDTVRERLEISLPFLDDKTRARLCGSVQPES